MGAVLGGACSRTRHGVSNASRQGALAAKGFGLTVQAV